MRVSFWPRVTRTILASYIHKNVAKTEGNSTFSRDINPKIEEITFEATISMNFIHYPPRFCVYEQSK